MAWITQLLGRPAVTWRDVLDVLVAAIAIYEVLKLIRGTRAAQMILGFGLITALYYASLALGLQTVNWMVRNVAGYVVFAVIVLFQSDIRRALAHLGRAPFFSYFVKTEPPEELIEELIVAASMLSSQKVGALIVVEREDGLRSYIEGGVPIEAQLTYDLLVCIFQPKAPLHDGAVIVQEDRIAAAACFLPLTVNPFVSKDLGTRHRSAIGLTEESDAIALVVSEETGRISIALDGRLESGLSIDDLRATLRRLVPRRRGASERTAPTRMESL